MTVPGKRGGLGRGLGALIPQGPQGDVAVPTDGPVGSVLADVEGARFAELPLTSIIPNPVQPRQVFDEEALAELTHSIKEIGLLQPIVVRPVGDDKYELIMGERRWRASQRAGIETIPAIVRETPDTDMLRDALLENLHRSQLNPLEEAAAYQQLLADFGATHEELSQRIGRSRPQISNTLRLLGLPPAVQAKVAAGVLSAGHAKAILGLPTAEAMEAMAHRVVAEGLSVRSTEEAVALASASAPTPKRGAAQKRQVPEAAREVADRLSDRLETRVKVDVGRSKGKITIEFATLEDLQRIAEIVHGQP
ncbi:MAG: ParB/RepB/Spo0J family partition protein [Mycobacteriales bacterium]